MSIKLNPKATYAALEVEVAEMHQQASHWFAENEKHEAEIAALQEALDNANRIIAMTRDHLARDHPQCAYEVLGIMNDASRALLAQPFDLVAHQKRMAREYVTEERLAKAIPDWAHPATHPPDAIFWKDQLTAAILRALFEEET